MTITDTVETEVDKISPVILPPKPYFVGLDGLRGIAAFGVLLGHSGLGITHNYLGVDLFFGLSGFVLASAYQVRFEKGLSVKQFLLIRLIRLYPLILLGAVLGALGVFKVYSPSILVTIFATGLLLIPTPFGALTEGGPALPANPPSWSLLFELLVNIFYACIAKRLTNWTIAALVLGSGAIMIYLTWQSGAVNLGGAWANVLCGFPRVVFSFFLGIAVFKAWSKYREVAPSIPMPISLLLLATIISVPHLGSSNWIYESVSITILFPILIFIAATAPQSRFAGFGKFVGVVSYPVYILQGGFVIHFKGLPEHLPFSPAVSTSIVVTVCLLFVLFSWVVYKLYDEPLRNFLTRQFLAPR